MVPPVASAVILDARNKCGHDKKVDLRGAWAMRAEIEHVVEEIKQSVGLLRRHL